jgi:hypothetical protein
MSHVKNLQAFEKLTGLCTGYGGSYNPGKQNLQVKAMSTLMYSAQTMMEEMAKAKADYTRIVNARESGFFGTRRLSSKVLAVLKSSRVDLLTLGDAVILNRKIWKGTKRGGPVTVPSGKEGEDSAPSVFTYGQNFGAIAQSFAELVELVSGIPGYQPNEPELTVRGLREWSDELKRLNAAVMEAELRFSEVRRKRNEVFYTGEESLYNTGNSARQYIRGVFGYGSPEHLEVMRLTIRRPRLKP